MASPNGHLIGEASYSPSLRRPSSALGMNGALVNGSAVPGDAYHQSGNFVGKPDDLQFMANLLAEERKRCNQHRENYNELKQQHKNLQNDLLNMQEDVRELNKEKMDLLENHAQEVGAYESQLTLLKNKVAELQSQIPAKDRIEALKTQMISEVEGPFRARLDNLEEDNKSLRTDNAKLKHDFTLLKTDYEHMLQRNKSMLDDLKLQHEAEVANLGHEKDDLVRRLHQENLTDNERLRTLQKDNSTLNLRVKSLLTELEELRSQREKAGLESDHITRLQNKQLAEFQANVRALEIEKDTLRKQVDSQTRELKVLVDSQTELTKRLHEEEQRVTSYRSQIEKVKHESSLQITQFKLDATKSQAGIEREKDTLSHQLDDVKSRVEAQQVVIEQLQSALSDKEREFADRINAIREEEFNKISQANHEKQLLESRIQILERQKLEYDDRVHREQQRLDQLTREHNSQKDVLEKELQSYRSKVTNQLQLQNELDYLRARADEQKSQCMKLEAENSALRLTENELTELVGNLRLKVSASHDELRRSKAQENMQNAAADKVLAQYKAVWSAEKEELRKRVDELESLLKECRETHAKSSSEYTKKKGIYAKLIEKLRKKLEIADAQRKQLKIQVESMKGYVPPEVFNQCKRELKELKNRHREYKHIMLSGDINYVPIGDKSFAAANVHNTTFDISPDQTQELSHLDDIIRRLDKIDDNQRKQLSELGVRSSRSSLSLDASSL